MSKKRILVLGGGFAGIECTRRLESYFKHNSEIELVLVSEDNFLLFTPMLPQVASGTIETRHIIIPIRTICKKAAFYEGKVKNIDLFGRRVTLYGTYEKRGISLQSTAAPSRGSLAYPPAISTGMSMVSVPVHTQAARKSLRCSHVSWPTSRRVAASVA